MQLIDCLQTLKRTHEAESVMQSAMEQWRGKPEEEKLILLNAQLQVSKGDPDGALAILSKVSPDQPNYQNARIKMAEIYLEEKKDKRMFTLCYRELMNSSQTPSNLTLLGDAYMSIQEPDKAIEVYEKALKLSGSRDIALTEKIGEAYVNCHLFSKAVNFYESAMNSNKDSKMRLKLAGLLLKLGNSEKCERILRQPLNDDPAPIDSLVISAHVQYLQLLSKLHLENGKITESLEDLHNAKQLQLKLIQKNVSDSPANTQAKKEVAKIDCMMAELRMTRREMKEALELYNDALSYEPTNLKAVLAMANIHLICNRLNKCQESCKQALVMDRHNEQAILMMADLMYLQNDVDGAMVHFVNLLDKFPNHYHALARYIELAWRNGHVEQVEKQLNRALEHNPRAIVDSGYNYCKALHQWYSGETNSALQSFNRARKDSEWGEKSICNMIEICLNPDNEVLGGESIDFEDGDPADREIGVKTAERFLNELRLKGQNSENRYQLMENFIMVSSRDKNKVQQAVQNLLLMIGPDSDDSIRKNKNNNPDIDGNKDTPVLSVGAVLGVARAYMLQKNVQKAKQILKRIVNHPWSLEDADYLEKCWLLLADIYIMQNKPEQTSNILKTVLSKNKCSLKAYELLGYLNEKEGKFVESAECYETAWKLSSKNNPIVGYKLAYNFLKCRRLFDCLEVCRHVLDKYPSYPRIKKEIMEKARMQLRS
ncbi:unnamed protein product [Auanema sp. JU1783]|nr:unnamed protein product [Auanema sp. JU1783]